MFAEDLECTPQLQYPHKGHTPNVMFYFSMGMVVRRGFVLECFRL